MTALDDRLAVLSSMTPAELRAEWRAQYRSPAPELGPDLLRRGIAWRLQARVRGDLTTATRRAIDQCLARRRASGVAGPALRATDNGERISRASGGRPARSPRPHRAHGPCRRYTKNGGKARKFTVKSRFERAQSSVKVQPIPGRKPLLLVPEAEDGWCGA
jgi:hypothetical protein